MRCPFCRENLQEPPGAFTCTCARWAQVFPQLRATRSQLRELNRLRRHKKKRREKPKPAFVFQFDDFIAIAGGVLVFIGISLLLYAFGKLTA